MLLLLCLFFYLFINVIISFFLINILMIAIIMFFVKYNTYNNFNLLIMSIDFLYLKYQLDKFLLNLYIRYSLL